ncbi:MAG TPA: response regulator [Ktedonobacterales bacterium]
MQPQDSEDADTCRGRILIVDDDADIREALSELLRDEGYEVLEAADGAVAMDVMLSSPQRLVVLLDLLMPHLSGFDVLTLVTEHEELAARHTFIVVTANKAASDSPDAVDPYFAALLEQRNIPVVSKPFNIDVLLDQVAQVTDGSETAEAHKRAFD